MRTAVLALALLAIPLAAASQAPDPAPAAPAPPPAAATAWRTLDPANTLIIDTTKGRIIVEMRPDLAPLTVARIKALTRSGYYDGALFYRVIQGFMAQTGDKGAKTYRSNLANLKGEMTFAYKSGLPFASVGSVPGGEVGYVGATPVMFASGEGGPVEGAQGNIVFCPGVAAMAHPANQPNGGNSQFFLMRQYAPTLEKEFAAWGRIVQGQDVVEAIRNGEPPPNPDKMTLLRVVGDIPAARRPTIEVSDLATPGFPALVQKVAAEKGAAFTLCDIPIEVRVTGG